MHRQKQQKEDIIQKINGEEMKGKVTRITDTDVSFIYSGETTRILHQKIRYPENNPCEWQGRGFLVR